MKESGFLPRFLVCHVKGEPHFLTREGEEEIASDVRVAYHTLIRSLLVVYRLASQPCTLVAEPEAHAVLLAHYNSVIARRISGELVDIESSVSRWTEQVWRLAVVLHAALHGSEAVDRAVTLATVQSAIAVADWFARRQLDLMEESRTKAKAELKNKIVGALVDVPEGLTAREIYRRLRLKPAFAAALLNEIVLGGEIDVNKRPTAGGGHPMNIYKRKSS